MYGMPGKQECWRRELEKYLQDQREKRIARMVASAMILLGLCCVGVVSCM